MDPIKGTRRGCEPPGTDSPSDHRGLNQHWGRHSQGQALMGPTPEYRASFHHMHHTGIPVAVGI